MAGQDAVQIGLDLAERLVRQLVQLGEDLVELLDVLLAGGQGHRVIVVEAQLAGGLVAELDEPDDVARDRLAHLLAGQPGLLPLGRVGLVLEDLLDLVVGDLAAVDRAAEGAEVLLDLGAQLDDLLEQLRLDLVRQVGVVEHGQLPGQELVLDLSGILELLEEREILRIAVDPADLQRQLAGAVVGLRVARHGGVPPGQVRLLLQRLDLLDVCRNEVLQGFLLCIRRIPARRDNRQNQRRYNHQMLHHRCTP